MAEAGGRRAREAPEIHAGERRAREAPEAAPALSCNVTFCPLCLAVTTVAEARPELVEHLLVAGRELLLAARALIDARLSATEAREEEQPTRIERISIE